jgi:hypothetical protein
VRWRPGPGWARRSRAGCATPASPSTRRRWPIWKGRRRPSTASGRFPVDVAPGRYLVCLADVFPDHSPGPPYSVVGCDHIDLPEAAALVVSFAEGGVEAALE